MVDNPRMHKAVSRREYRKWAKEEEAWGWPDRMGNEPEACTTLKSIVNAIYDPDDSAVEKLRNIYKILYG